MGSERGTQGAEEAIAEVLRKHRPQGFHFTLYAPMCTCGDTGEYMAHAAALAVEALGLTPERRELADGMGSVMTNWKTGETTSQFRPCTKQVRWVTKWEAP